MPILSLIISENEEVPVVHNMKFIKCFCSNTAYSYNLCSDNTMSNVSVLTADLKYTVELLNEYRIVRRRNHSYHQGVYMYLSVLGTNIDPQTSPCSQHWLSHIGLSVQSWLHCCSFSFCWLAWEYKGRWLN